MIEILILTLGDPTFRGEPDAWVRRFNKLSRRTQIEVLFYLIKLDTLEIVQRYDAKVMAAMQETHKQLSNHVDNSDSDATVLSGLRLAEITFDVLFAANKSFREQATLEGLLTDPSSN